MVHLNGDVNYISVKLFKNNTQTISPHSAVLGKNTWLVPAETYYSKMEGPGI